MDKSQYRCSLINIEQSQDDELDAILGELSELETQFTKEIVLEERKRSSDESSNIYSILSAPSQGESSSREGREATSSSSRNCSPDTDSAFCDNLSLLSSCSASSSNNQVSSGVSSALSHSQPAEQEAKIKAEKIKIAIEKIKEASVKKLFIKVFTSDGSAKSLLVDEKMTVGQVSRILAEKNHVSLDPKWALVELVPDLYMERVYEDHEMLVENCLLWKVDSKNTLWFIERPEKCDLFLRPEIYLLGSSSSQRDDPMEEHCRQELVEEYFSSTSVGAPQLEGYIWLKAENKKSWKKVHFKLRTSGLYYSPKGKKTSKDLLCLCTFDVNQVYYGVGWKRKFKAPTDFCFGIKHPQIQAKNPKYIRYLCVDSQKELHQWVTGIRMAKNGKPLHENYRGLVDEMTHADIDILVGKRGSTNSALCLVGPAKAESCATNLNLQLNCPSSPAISPLSENKSFDSALSSGIRSDHYLDQSLGSTDLARFDLRINEERSRQSPLAPLRRTSKSSSSLSDKSSAEQGFESDHPAGGTIKKRPPPPPGSSSAETGGGGKAGQGEAGEKMFTGNIRIGAGGTLLRRTNSAERLTVTSGRNYEELQQLLDELHTNVKQAKDIQAKLSKQMAPAEDSGDVGFPPPPETPPPPPLRTSSRLSMEEDLLPPPPPELQSPSFTGAHSAGLRKNLPPIAPKPNLSRVPGSPKFKPGYGTLPNPGKKSQQPKSPPGSSEQKYKLGRRISFDDNIQLIEEGPGPLNNNSKVGSSSLSPGFLPSLEKVVGSRLPPPSSPCLPRTTAEPLYTAVVKPGSANSRPRHYHAPALTPALSPAPAPAPVSCLPPAGQRMLPGSPGGGVARVCCVGSLRCRGSADSSPEQVRGGQPFTGDYWQADTAHNNLWPPRSCSEEKTRPCDDILHLSSKPRHSSVPSSPVSSQSNRLWGSFRGGKKPPAIDKSLLKNPYLKTAS